MAKQLLYTDEARKKLLSGAEKLARAVGSTLGPTGRNVIIDKSFGGPHVTKDGVTVSKEIDLPDPFENMGAKLVNAVAQKTSDSAGDGTTTATILALAIYQEGLRNITAGANPMAVKRGIDKAVTAAINYLEDEKNGLRRTIRPIDKGGRDDLENIASISANNDPKIGKRMAEAFAKIGRDGVITVEEGKTSETQLEFVEGMQFDKGYLSPYFVVGTPELKWEQKDVYVLIYEKKLANVREMIPILDRVRRAGKPLLIIAEDVESEALAMLVVNRLKGHIDVCAVKAPGFGDRRKAMMEDIAVLTGGTFVSEDRGIKLDSMTQPSPQEQQRGAQPEPVVFNLLGHADQVVVDKENTTIIVEPDDEREKAIAARVQTIRTQMEQTESEYDKEKFSERLAKLVGGVAIIKVGASTEAEMKQTKGRVEDALHATRAAVSEGIVAGGGVALLRCVSAVKTAEDKLRGDEKIGADIVARALQKPIRTIAENCGVDGAVIADEVATRGEKDPNIGYDANTGKFVDMFKAGILDPLRVTRSALQNAASIAGLMLTTEVLVTRIDEDEKKPKVVSGAVA
ncbi:MAG: chaperonin GroEL [Planctomycetia bacterium]|nr:chaperonin GroEL [Planctomycetia bacterium]